MNLMSSLNGGDDNQDEKVTPKHPNGDDHEVEEEEESPSEANKQREEDEMVTVMLGRTTAAECLSLTIVKKMKMMFL